MFVPRRITLLKQGYRLEVTELRLSCVKKNIKCANGGRFEFFNAKNKIYE